MEIESKVRVFKDIYFYPPESTASRPIETLFTNLPKADQYWRRQTDFVVNKDYPNLFFDYDPHLPEKKRCRINAIQTQYSGSRLVSLSVEDTQSLIDLVQRELRRMKFGIYIMNNGVKIYFPGVFYGAMQWCKFLGVSKNNGYGSHKRYQREFSCQRQKVIEDDKLTGYYQHKIKKSGITQLLACFSAIESITTKQYCSADMSKTHDTAKAANFQYYLYAMKNMPAILLPTIEQSGWKTAAQKVVIRSENPEFSLENTVVAVPTTEDGLDGLPPIKRIKLSEFPKMTLAEQILKKSKEQARLQQTKVGIIEIESYPPENDSKSFRYAKEFYMKDCMQVDEDGYPVNGFVPLYIGLLEATNDTHDVYGEPDKAKALQMEMVARGKCDTPSKLQSRKRQYHMTAKEGWEAGGGGSVYNNIALTEQQTVLEEQYYHGQLNYRLANLEWTEGFGSMVRIVFLTLEEIRDGKTGKWRIFVDDEYLKQNTNICFRLSRKSKTVNGEKLKLLRPPTDNIHVGGTDPVDYAYVSEVEAPSKNASVIRNITGKLISVYHDRPEDPDEALEDFCKEMICFGTHSIVEGNRKNAVTTLEKLGMYYFMLIRHPNGDIKPYGQTVKIKHISSSKDLKSKYVELVTKHITNNIEYFQDVPTIEQHKDFNPADTQIYDLAVGDGLSFVALDAMQSWMLSNKTHQDKYASLGAAVQRLG